MQQKSHHSNNDVISTSYGWGMIANREKSKLQEINPLIKGLHELDNDDETDADIEIKNIAGSLHGGGSGGNSGGMSNIVLPSQHTQNTKHTQNSKDDDDVIKSLINDNTYSKHSTHHDSPKHHHSSKHHDSPRRDSPRRDSPRRKSPDHHKSKRHDSSESNYKEKEKDKNNDPSKWSKEEMNLKKLEIYALLEELKLYGVELSNTYTLDSDYVTMKREYDFHRTLRDKRGAVDLYEKGFTSGVIGLELMNESKYNPFKLKLKGYSHHVRSEMNTYREIFADFYEKYKEKNGKISPETRFFFTFVGGAVMFHMSKCNEEQEQIDNDRIQRMVDETIEKKFEQILKSRNIQPALRPVIQQPIINTTMPVRSQIVLPDPPRAVTPAPQYQQPQYQQPQYQQPQYQQPQYQPTQYQTPNGMNHLGGQIPVFAQPSYRYPINDNTVLPEQSYQFKKNDSPRDSIEDKIKNKRMSSPSPKRKSHKRNSTSSKSRKSREVFVDTEHA